MRNRGWYNFRQSFSELGTLLAWLAIFLWLSDYAWRFTGLDGFLNTLHRLTIRNWLNWKPIVGDNWQTTTASVFYWFGIAMALLVFILLVRKLFTQHKDDPLQRVARTLDGIKESIDNLSNEIRLDREDRIRKAKPDDPIE